MELKTRRTEVAPRQINADPAQMVEAGMGELKAEVQCTIAVDDIAIIGSSPIDQIVIVLLIYLIIKEIRNHDLCTPRGLGSGLDTFPPSLVHGKEHIGIIVIGIRGMHEGFLGHGIIPNHRSAGIEKNVIAIVETAIALTAHQNRNLHKIGVPRFRVQFAKHTAAIVKEADVTGIDTVDIDPQGAPRPP